MKEILFAQGWTMTETCNCGGSLRQTFKHEKFPGYEIRIRPTKHIFYILFRGMYVQNPMHSIELADKMKELKIFAV